VKDDSKKNKAFGVKRFLSSDLSLEGPPSFIRHSSFVIRHSSFVIRHSSFVIRHSSFVIRHSSFVIPAPARLVSPFQPPGLAPLSWLKGLSRSA
jgi:hypothetical protein